MFKARYFQADGSAGEARELPEAIFDGVVNDDALHQVVTAHLANRRAGTGSAKNRSAVAGGSRKPWRQKGTGRARQGTIRAAQWAGGGRAFPPIPHSWRQRINRKVKALARRSALNTRAAGDDVVVVGALEFEKPKTAELRDLLAEMEIGSSKALILTAGHKPNVYLSGRNLPNVETRRFGTESAYDILWAETLVIEEAALEGDAAVEEGDDDA